MQLDANYDEKSMTGKMTGNVQMPIGTMRMDIDITSRRIGDCKE